MKIVTYPHPSLRHRARALTAIDKKVQLHAAEMLALMYEAKGIGLAATQVELPYQLLVMNVTGDPDQKDQEHVFVNPVILEQKGSVEEEEGCLSLPGLYQKVRRSKTVKAEAYNLEGARLLLEWGDMPARVLQHEIDHLKGVLFIDRLGPIGKLASRGALKDFERKYRKAQERGEIPPDQEIEKSLVALEANA